MRPIAVLFTLLLWLGCSSPPPKPQPARITVGTTLGCNKLVHYVKPIYPKEAKRKRIQGTVRLRALLTKTGELRNLEVLKGDPVLVPAALSAARQWRYAPCLVNSEAVDVITVLDLGFNLNQ